MRTASLIFLGLTVVLAILALLFGGHIARLGLLAGAAACLIVCLQFAFMARAETKHRAESRRLRETGTPAKVAIVRVETTGLKVNGNPQLRLTLNVDRGGQDVYQLSHTQLVADRLAPTLQPGDIYDGFVDPGDPTGLLVPGWNEADAEPHTPLTEDDVDRLRREGRAAHATIRETFAVDEPPGGLGLDLEVQVDDGRPRFRVRVVHPPPRIRTRQVTDLVGREVAAYVDRRVPQRVAIDWASLA